MPGIVSIDIPAMSWPPAGVLELADVDGLGTAVFDVLPALSVATAETDRAACA
ncbi:MAG TPA: hypothetical protein VGH80_07515 [Xanthomonadaceae bacterium]